MGLDLDEYLPILWSSLDSIDPQPIDDHADTTLLDSLHHTPLTTRMSTRKRKHGGDEDEEEIEEEEEEEIALKEGEKDVKEGEIPEAVLISISTLMSKLKEDA